MKQHEKAGGGLTFGAGLMRSVHFNDKSNGGGNNGLSVIELEPAGDLGDPKNLVREMETFSGMWRQMFKDGRILQNKNGGYTIKAEEDVRQLEAREQAVLQEHQVRLSNMETLLKTNTSRFSGGDSDEITIRKASMVLRVDKDPELRHINPVYFNVIALRAAELAGVCQLDADRVPGLNGGVQRWASNQRGAATIGHVSRIQWCNDRMLLRYHVLCSLNKSYAKQYGTTEAAMRTYPEWPEWERLWTETYAAMGEKRAMDETTTTKGGFLVPVIMSGSVAEIAERQAIVANLFPSFTMRSNVFQWPILTGHVTLYVPGGQTPPTGEVTFDHATYAAPPVDAIPASNPTFGRPQWTATKLAGLAFISSELEEDAIEGSLDLLQNDFGVAFALGKDDTFINAERAGVTMDGATFNPANGQRRWINGLRFHALMTASTPAALDMGNVAITADKGIELQQAMGYWGSDPGDFVWIAGYRAYHSMRKLMLNPVNTADFQTLSAVVGLDVPRGTVATFLSSPVVLSEKMVDLNASGKYDGVTTNRGSLLGVRRSRWFYGDRRGVTIDVSSHVAFRSDQDAVRGTMRGDLQPIDTPSATKTPVGIIYNIA